MNLDDWFKQKHERAKSKARKSLYQWVYDRPNERWGDYHKGIAGKVKAIECDDGLLVAAIIGDQIHHYLITGASGEFEIKERGLEDWPRGRTKFLDDLAETLDGELVGDETATRRFLDKHGPIAAERRLQEQRRNRPKLKRKKK